MATKQEINKIIIVLIILVVLLIGLVYIRVKRKNELKNSQGQHIVEIVPTTRPTEEPTGSGVLSVLPNRLNVKLNVPFQLTVQINAINKKVDGADVYLSYDSRILEVVDLIPGQFFSTYPRKTIDNTSGSIKVTGFNNTIKDPLSRPETFFTLSLVGKKIGNSQIQIGFIKGQTAQSNIVEHQTSKNLLGKVDNAVVIVGEQCTIYL